MLKETRIIYNPSFELQLEQVQSVAPVTSDSSDQSKGKTGDQKVLMTEICPTMI